MQKTIWKSARSANQGGRRPSRNRVGPTLKNPPPNLASLIRGLYGRVARKLGVDPSYVSRVARSERRSEAVDAELVRQLGEIVKLARKRSGKYRKKSAD